MRSRPLQAEAAAGFSTLHHAAAGELKPGALERVQREARLDRVEEARVNSGRASLRRRKLPAEMVGWLVLGVGRFRNRKLVNVLTSLGPAEAEEHGRLSVARSAVRQPQQRRWGRPWRT